MYIGTVLHIDDMNTNRILRRHRESCSNRELRPNRESGTNRQSRILTSDYTIQASLNLPNYEDIFPNYIAEPDPCPPYEIRIETIDEIEERIKEERIKLDKSLEAIKARRKQDKVNEKKRLAEEKIMEKKRHDEIKLKKIKKINNKELQVVKEEFNVYWTNIGKACDGCLKAVIFTGGLSFILIPVIGVLGAVYYIGKVIKYNIKKKIYKLFNRI